MDDAAKSDAERFADLYPEIFLRLHTRRERGAIEVSRQMWGMLQHFALTGPLTIGEAAQHFDRAQSVVSETVDALEAKGLVERMPDARDRRRTLVWLTDEAHAFMKRERRVLDDERLTLAMTVMSPSARRSLIAGMQALVESCDVVAKNAHAKREAHDVPTRPTRKKKEKNR